MFSDQIRNIAPEIPVLIAGPTASGKSALALAIAESHGGVVVNADASQVFDCWDVISARPDVDELSRADHALYGHVPYDAPYSAGHWLREVTPMLLEPGPRPIIVGGTGLYFAALTEGLTHIPATPDVLRAQADGMSLDHLRAGLDTPTLSRIDTANRARVQRAWEVLHATGRGLAAWQDDTPPPLLGPDKAVRIVIDAPKDWLTPRIDARFDAMLTRGALDEVRAMLDRYDPGLPSCRAIGVPELVAYLRGQSTLDQARERAVIATRQYAKRQRTWLRKRCADWRWVAAHGLT